MTTETRHDMATSIFYWHLPDGAHESGCALRCGYDGDDLCKHLADELENAGLLSDASEIWRAVLTWAERFEVGDCWDDEDFHDLDSALKGVVESHPTAHWRRKTQEALRQHRNDWASWISNHGQYVGTVPMTQEQIVEALRCEHVPFGCSANPDIEAKP